MAAARFTLENKAYELFAKVMSDTAACREAFVRAGLSLPPPLLRFFDEAEPEQSGPRMSLSPPAIPERPAEATGDWVWIPLRDMLPTGLVLGLLRSDPAGLTQKDILARLAQMPGVNVNPGSIANIGTRLANEGVITRERGVWEIVDPDRAPIILGENAWAPKDLFEQQELAGHRRNCIIHVLQAQPDGLQIMQIVKLLEGRDWQRAPLSKDLVKTDLRQLDKEGRAKRVGNSGKWRSTQND